MPTLHTSRPHSIVTRAATAAITVATLANGAIAQSSQLVSSSPLLFRNVRVFDGTRVVAGQDVLVENGRIAKVGRASRRIGAHGA